jgi:hypothetical protein
MYLAKKTRETAADNDSDFSLFTAEEIAELR